jgi:hypothetical protein
MYLKLNGFQFSNSLYGYIPYRVYKLLEQEAVVGGRGGALL